MNDCSSSTEWAIYKGKPKENFIRHKNLSNFLNAMVSFQLKEKIKNQTTFNKLIDIFFKYAIENFKNLSTVVPSKNKLFSLKPSATDNSIFIRVFDNFYKNSLIGNLNTLVFSIDNFFPLYFKNINHENTVKTLHIENIKFTNSFGSCLQSYKITENKEEALKKIETISVSGVRLFDFRDKQPSLEIKTMDPKCVIGLYKFNQIATYEMSSF